jgi:hypothetical protein
MRLFHFYSVPYFYVHSVSPLFRTLIFCSSAAHNSGAVSGDAAGVYLSAFGIRRKGYNNVD